MPGGGLLKSLGGGVDLGDLFGKFGRTKAKPPSVDDAKEAGKMAGEEGVEVERKAQAEDGEDPQKECDWESFMLGNNPASWSRLQKDIKWSYDHALFGKELHVWFPGRATEGECNDLTDKTRGCWFRSRLLADPGCTVKNRCLHIAGHDGDPNYTYTCPTWVKDSDGTTCKLPPGWQACPTKFNMARVDTGIPQFLKEAEAQPCDLNEGEKLFVGDWREEHSTIRYKIRKTDMAELEVTVEPNGQPQVINIPGQPPAPPFPKAPSESELLRRGQPRSEGVPGIGLAGMQALKGKRAAEAAEGPDENLRYTGILLPQGEWMHADLQDEHGADAGAEVKLQVDEKGAMKATFLAGGDEKKEWTEPTEVIRDVKTLGGTAHGASCSFPFKYKGIEYHDCTMVDQGEPWCRTDELGNWGFCQGHASRPKPPLIGTHGGDFQGSGPKCLLPFSHNSSIYNTCKVIEDITKDGLICLTDTEGSWGYCNCEVDKTPDAEIETHGGTAKGAKCKFPFKYEGREYNTCEDFGDGAPACLTDDKGHWGYCNCKKPLHLVGPAGFDKEDKADAKAEAEGGEDKEKEEPKDYSHRKTPTGARRPFHHCHGSTAGATDIYMIFDARRNMWHRCTEQFRCESYDIAAIHEPVDGDCGDAGRCKEDEVCFDHRSTSKQLDHQCVKTERIYVLPDGDDPVKFAAPWPLALWAPPPLARRTARGPQRGRRRPRPARFL